MEEENPQNNQNQSQNQNQKDNWNEEEWEKQWQEAQEKAQKQKQQQLQQSGKQAGPSSMQIDGQGVEQIPEDQLPYMTYDELLQFDGIKEKKAYVAVCDIVFDTTGSGFYGPGESYHHLAGHEASVSLSKMSFEDVFLDKYGIYGMTKKELECLRDWYDKFTLKYKKVAKLKPKTEDQITEKDKEDFEKIKNNNYNNPCMQQ
ncbi:Cytochrome b5-like heme/steroid binding domain [Pseudocohnilembus persalinus]|uniref:Cytochrome b5-like heme/steroid binding domain n=1 Tax=Pseudocohnilembus persalinus TaxID=266149 RepID=A0A0V0QH25_PSEPJ|nr:Cytochrome b5-like heme/steroid binding domain [Pseudocohnilembus persalinus]|eukprot:KRX01468.1 Cytochrome b5-like heme/steroid binding domain [Pseudocohnilembus persalinus]